MKLYGVDLPEPKEGNEIKILKTCRDIHIAECERRLRNTKRTQWEEYWVKAYDFVIETLEKRK